MPSSSSCLMSSAFQTSHRLPVQHRIARFSNKSASSSTSSSTSHPSFLQPQDRLIYKTGVLTQNRLAPWLCVILAPIMYKLSTYSEQSNQRLSPAKAMILPGLILGLAAAFFRHNSRLVSSIRLLPQRRLEIQTVGFLRPSVQQHYLDTLIPAVAWSGAQDKILEKMRFVQADGSAGFISYNIYKDSNRVPKAEFDLFQLIMSENCLKKKDLMP